MSAEPSSKDTRPRIILVDDEEVIVMWLSARLAELRPSYTLESATSGKAALELLKTGRADLLITDIKMRGMQGTELIVLARQIHRDLPVIVMTAHSDAELRIQAVQGSIEYFDKPIDFEALLACVDQILDRRRVGFSGAILVQTLPDIVQLYALSSATGALQIRRRLKEGMIWFERGEIVHASADEITGVDAFYEIMRWSGGEFSMEIGSEAPSRTIRMRWTELLMESCRLLDESRREIVPSSGPTSRRGWTLSGGPPSAPSGPSSASSASISSGGASPASPQAATALPEPAPPGPPQRDIDLDFDGMFGEERRTKSVTSYQNSVDKLAKIDGFIAAAVVDCASGMVLCQNMGRPFDIEVAAAGDAQVFMAKRAVLGSLGLKDDIEDILISLTTQYHLIRSVRSNPEIFLSLILDRRRANLAMARRTLNDVAGEVT